MTMRIAVLFPGALGDLLLLAPALAAVAAAGTTVDLAVRRALADLAKELAVPGPPVDGALVSALFAGAAPPALAAWLAPVDVVHAWIGAPDPAVRAAARAAGVRDVRFHAVVRTDGEAHASADYAGALGIVGAPAPLRLPRPDAPPPVPWGVASAHRLVLHPGAGSAAKRWSSDGLRWVADDRCRRGGEVVVLLGPAEEGLAPFWQASGHAVARGCSLAAAAALVASAPQFVGNDSGVSHLAGALGCAGVVVFTTTRPERWRPRGGALTVVRAAGRSAAEVACEVAARLAACRRGEVP